MGNFQHRRNTVGCKMINEKEESRLASSAAKKKIIKKNENWKEKCKDCEVLKLEMGCAFGCEMLKASNKKN
jgi:sulfatase maturation enzyme AslB (radical SAM superfamily)